MHHLRSYQLAVQFYQVTREIKLTPDLQNQFRRAASSVALNLNEGWGRRRYADRRRFFTIAMGSIRECQASVELENEKFTSDLRDLLDHLAASTFKLIGNFRDPQPAIR